MNRLLTCDIDLHRCHLYDATDEEVVVVDGSVRDLMTHIKARSYLNSVILAIELASPRLYRGVATSTLRWMGYNLLAVGMLGHQFSIDPNVHVHVAGSDSWTKGYNEAKRHKLAKATDEVGYTKDQNHNIKEMKAMAWMYRRAPGLWKPYEEYIECL